MERVKITILVDNQTNSTLECEHGLSLFIETEERKILCDMGASDKFLTNATQMGIDLNSIDFAFISHGHSDHTGGLGAFLKAIPSKKVYASNAIFKEYYFSGRRGYWRAMSTDHSLIEEYGERFELLDITGGNESNTGKDLFGKWVTPQIAIVANNCNRWSRPYGNIYLTKELASEVDSPLQADPSHLLPDNFQHELSLALLTPDGLVIISSCSHCGALNIIESSIEFTGERRIAAFIGGLHFIDSPEVAKEVEGFAKEFERFVKEFAESIPASARVITGHCTSNPAKELLREKIPGIEFFYTGAIFEIYSSLS